MEEGGHWPPFFMRRSMSLRPRCPDEHCRAGPDPGEDHTAGGSEHPVVEHRRGAGGDAGERAGGRGARRQGDPAGDAQGSADAGLGLEHRALRQIPGAGGPHPEGAWQPGALGPGARDLQAAVRVARTEGVRPPHQQLHPGRRRAGGGGRRGGAAAVGRVPECFNRYATIRASRVFAGRLVTDDTLFRFTAMDEQQAWAELERMEAENEQPNILWDGPRMFPIPTYNPGAGLLRNGTGVGIQRLGF